MKKSTNALLIILLAAGCKSGDKKADKPSGEPADKAGKVVEPAETKPAETKPAETKPAEAKPAEALDPNEESDVVALCGFLQECTVDDTCQQNLKASHKQLSELPMKTEWGKSVRQSMLDDLKAIADFKPCVGVERLLEKVEANKIEGPGFECKNIEDWQRL